MNDELLSQRYHVLLFEETNVLGKRSLRLTTHLCVLRTQCYMIAH